MVPPHPPNPTDEQVLRMAMAGPWRRFFARLFDTSWELFLVTMVAGVILFMTVSGFEQWLHGFGHAYLVGPRLHAVRLHFGRDRVRHCGQYAGQSAAVSEGGRHPRPAARLLALLGEKPLRVVDGPGFGIILVAPVTQTIQYWRVARGERANYDEKRGDIVKARPAGVVRVSAFVMLLFALMMGQLGAQKRRAEPGGAPIWRVMPRKAMRGAGSQESFRTRRTGAIRSRGKASPYRSCGRSAPNRTRQATHPIDLMIGETAPCSCRPRSVSHNST